MNKLRAHPIERIASLPAGTNTLIVLPIGFLNGPQSILAVLRSRGADVTAIG
jgi:hypothetical protein